MLSRKRRLVPNGQVDKLGGKRLVFDLARARRLKAEGWTIRQLADLFGVSPMTIQRQISAL